MKSYSRLSPLLEKCCLRLDANGSYQNAEQEIKALIGVNYDYCQTQQLCSIGLGAVESAVKQINIKLKISGRQWKPENVS